MTSRRAWRGASRQLGRSSGGLAGWKLVTTFNPGDTLNVSHEEYVPREDRHERAGEFAQVAKGLWDSWPDDALPQAKASGRFLETANLHPLNFRGKHCPVAGPLNAPGPPQGHRVIFSAGQSETGRELSAADADCVFAIEGTIECVQMRHRDLKARLAKYGRAPQSLNFLSGVTIPDG